MRVEIEFGDVLLFDAVLRPAPDLRGQPLDEILGEAECFPDIADRALALVADEGRAERGIVAAIGFEHPLHHDLAPLMLEVDIDIGRLLALLADEALEQEIAAFWIDRGDAEHVADRRIGGRSSSLTEDVATAREAHDRVHRQKVWCIFHRGDQRQFVSEDLRDLVGQAVGIARLGRLPCQRLQRLLGRLPFDGRLFRILVGKFVEREAAAIGDLQRPRECVGITLIAGMAPLQPTSLGGMLQNRSATAA